jgi:hypothetical protein
MLVRSPEGQLTTYSGLGVWQVDALQHQFARARESLEAMDGAEMSVQMQDEMAAAYNARLLPSPQVTIILLVDNQPILRENMICHLPYATCSLNPCRAFKVVNSAHGSLCPPATNYLSPICWVHSRLGKLRDIIGIYSELPVFAEKS